jgi:hypothetical protein
MQTEILLQGGDNMWIRISDKKLINTQFISAFEIHELTDDLAEVIVYFPDGLNFHITDMLTFDQCVGYVNALQNYMIDYKPDAIIDLRT